MPASAMVRVRSFSPCLSVTFSLRACSNNRLRSGNSDGGLRLAPLGLPLWPGLNWYSLGGRPGPTLYSGVAETVRRLQPFCPPFDDGLEAMMKSFHKFDLVSRAEPFVLVWSFPITDSLGGVHSGLSLLPWRTAGAEPAADAMIRVLAISSKPRPVSAQMASFLEKVCQRLIATSTKRGSISSA